MSTPPFDSFFPADMEEERVDTEAGELPVPVCFYEASVLGLVYRVEPEVAAALVSRDELEPLDTMGKALVQLFVIEARKTNVGRFCEVALALHVHRSGTSPSKVRALLDSHTEIDQGYLVVAAAVDGPLMLTACQALWGLPAYEASVDVDFRVSGVRAAIGGELEIMIGEPGRVKTPGLPITFLGAEMGDLRRTTVDVDHRLEWGGGASATVRAQGDGPIAESLLRLGLESTKPSHVWRAQTSRAKLPRGIAI